MQRWPLRLMLSAILAALLIVGFVLQHPHQAVADPPTTTSSAPTNANATTSTRAVTTTTAPPPYHPTRSQSPVTSTAAFAPPRRGCHFASTPAVALASAHVALGRCVVLEVGDSLGNDLGWGLARELSRTPGLQLKLMDISSTGLVTPWYYNWPRHLRHFLHQYRPHLIVMTFGANDEQGIVVNGRAAIFGSVKWLAAYRARVLAMTNLASKFGSYVLWVGMPIMQPVQYRQGAEILNSLYSSVVRNVPGATFLPTYNLLATPKLDFRTAARVNGVPEILRASDGIHFSYVGENVLATYVVRRIASIYHVRIAPSAPMNLTN
jgi:hypothetical protein